jgi:Tfp pilus assembly protein PilE
MGKSIISVIGLIAAISIFFFYTKPTYDGAQIKRAEITEYDAALLKATELQERKQALLKRYNEFSPEDRDRLQKLLPDHVDNVRLILDLDNIASRRGMALQNVVVSTPGAGQTTQTAVGTISSSKQKYDTLTTKFTTQGTYAALQQLITDLETSLRVIDLVNLRISPGGQEGVLTAEPIYSFEVTLRTYWLK